MDKLRKVLGNWLFKLAALVSPDKKSKLSRNQRGDVVIPTFVVIIIVIILLFWIF